MTYILKFIKYTAVLALVYLFINLGLLFLLPVGIASADDWGFDFDSYSTGDLTGQDGWTTVSGYASSKVVSSNYYSSPNSVNGVSSGTDGRNIHSMSLTTPYTFYIKGTDDGNSGGIYFGNSIDGLTVDYFRLYKSDNDLVCRTRKNSISNDVVTVDSSFFDNTWKKITITYSGNEFFLNGVSCNESTVSNLNELRIYSSTLQSLFFDGEGIAVTPAPTVPVSAWNAKGHEAIFDVTCNATGELWDDFGGTFTKYADCTSGVATEVSLYSDELSETPVTVNFQTRNANGNSASAPYSVTFAPFDPPSVPADFQIIPYTVEFDVTCQEDMDLTYMIEIETGLVDLPLMSYRALKEDCEVDEVVHVSEVVPDGGTYNFFFQHATVGGDSSEYAIVVVDVGFEYATYGIPVLNPDVDGKTFTTEDITVYFETQSSGYIECTNSDTGQSFRSYNYALDILHIADLELSLEPNTNTFNCQQTGQWGQSEVLTFSVDYVITDLPILPASPWTNKTLYRLVIDVSENTLDDLLCRAGDDTFAIIADVLSTNKKYYDIDLTGYEGFDLTNGFELPIDCYFDDGVGTEVQTILAFRPMIPSSSDNIFCYASENQYNPDDGSKWEVKYWYHRIESMFTRIPIIGDIGEINCYMYNHLLLPLWDWVGGAPFAQIGFTGTQNIGDVFTISSHTLDIKGEMELLESQGVISRDGTGDSEISTQMKAILTAFLWLIWIGLIYFLFHKSSDNG